MFVRLVLVSLLVALLWWGFAPRGSEASQGERSYVVQPADTLWSIAESHLGGDPREGVWRLQERNRLETALLRPGQRLIIP